MAVTQTAPEPTQVKIVEPHTLLERFNQLSEQISRRAFEIFESNGRRPGHDLEDWFKAESEILCPLQLRIIEKNDALIVEAEMPGFSASNLEVGLEPWRLTIGGIRETRQELKKGKTIYQEQSSNELLRVIDLPAETDGAKATATLKDGILEINLPKITNAITKRSDVKAA